MPATLAAPAKVQELLETRILILDGAMGSLLQKLNLSEVEVRGERFAKHTKDMIRFSDILCLTNPEAISNIHRQYLEAGADIIETNSFNASPIGAMEFELPDTVIREINFAAVACA